MIDAEDVNEINTENYVQEQEERVLKNKILNMSNTKKKQEQWLQFFGITQAQDDSYLAGGIY